MFFVVAPTASSCWRQCSVVVSALQHAAKPEIDQFHMPSRVEHAIEGKRRCRLERWLALTPQRSCVGFF